jgi:hypothetical protein
MRKSWSAGRSDNHGVNLSLPAFMKSHYFRVTVFSVPTQIATPDLSTLAYMGYTLTVLEGYLRTTPRLAGTINMRGVYRNGTANELIHVSTSILRTQGNYFLTARCLYQVFRVPCCSGGEHLVRGDGGDGCRNT